jgi:DNA replication protein DnaC
MMTEELEQLLKNLKLRRILEIYDEQLRAADKDDISYSDFVTRLVRAQFQAKQEGALEWRIRRANLPERWTLETFPFARQTGREPQTDARFRRTGVHHQGGEYRAGRQDRCRQNGISVRLATESAGERLSLPVHPRAGSIR